MAFLHCNNCTWQQDDFWETDGYNPFRKDILEYWVEIMKEGIAGERTIGMDSGWVKETGLASVMIDGQSHVNFRDYLAWELERKAKNIKKMNWVTWEDFKNDPDPVCPNCGSNELDID